MFVPLEIMRLRLDEPVNFNIYVQSKNSRGETNYVLFCREGESFNHHSTLKLKLYDIHAVYYRKADKELVERYLSSPGRLIGERGKRPSEAKILRVSGPHPGWANAAAMTGESYFPLASRNLPPGTKFPFDLFLKITRETGVAAHYAPFLTRGTVYSHALENELHQKRIEFLYFHQRDGGKVFDYLNHQLDWQFRDGKIIPATKAGLIYDTTLLWIRRFLYYSEYNKPGVELEIGSKLIGYLLKVFHEDPQSHRWLHKIRAHDGGLPVHSLNTCLLGMGFAKYLDWPDEKILEFGQGVLLHDIGMVKVPPGVLNKSGGLSESEMRLVRKHPEDSCRILREIASLSKSSLQMVMQHHEAGDGSGYPKALKISLINHWARVLRIINIYEALTSNRSWRQRFNSLKALKIMRQECLDSGAFDLHYLAGFIQFLSGK